MLTVQVSPMSRRRMLLNFQIANAGIIGDTSFAMHLLEKGTDIRDVKDLLGHFDIKNTGRYLHVSRKALVNIVNPLDDLFHKGRIDW
jgi:hypothetical protein